MDTAHPMTGALAKKLAGILSQTGRLKKEGHNEHFNYDFITESTLSGAVRDLLAAAGVFLFTSVISQEVREIVQPGKQEQGERRTLLTLVTTEHTFVDGDSGESFTVKSQGHSLDNGDKGVYKAITGAVKYALYKNFLFPTGDDPEIANEAGDGGYGGARTAAPRPAPRAEGVRNPPAAPAAQATLPGVPRDPGVGQEGPAVPGGRWEIVVLHFGKNKGIKLGDLDQNSLSWYANQWEPKPYNGKISPQDLLLRKALNLYLDSQGR
jgi:hypothetical protein